MLLYINRACHTAVPLNVSRGLPVLLFFAGGKVHTPPAVGFSIIINRKSIISSLSIPKIQDRDVIFQHVVMVTSVDDLIKEKVGVPVHLLFNMIAGPAGRRDFENWC